MSPQDNQGAEAAAQTKSYDWQQKIGKDIQARDIALDGLAR